MPDTDDDPNVALEPDQHEPGDDPESASERRAHALDQQRNERLVAVTGLTAEEEAALREEDELAAARAEDLELATKDENERVEHRRREETLDAGAAATRDARAEEAAQAYRLAHIDERDSKRERELGDTARLHAVSDQARGGHKLDEAEARWDQPGAAGLAASGRRDQRAAGHEDRRATEHGIVADEYADRARERRVEGHEAQVGQAPPSGAVHEPPKTAPEARRFVREELRIKRTPSQKKTPDPSMEPDLEI